MVVGLVLSLAGDVFLMLAEKWFVAGLVSFLARAHRLHRGPAAGPDVGCGWTLGRPALVVGVASPWSAGGSSGRGRRATPARWSARSIAYLVVISAMVVSAFGTGGPVGHRGRRSLFYASDATLAWNRFLEPRRCGPLAVMVTYHLGQIGLVAWLVWAWHAALISVGAVIRRSCVVGGRPRRCVRPGTDDAGPAGHRTGGGARRSAGGSSPRCRPRSVPGEISSGPRADGSRAGRACDEARRGAAPGRRQTRRRGPPRGGPARGGARPTRTWPRSAPALAGRPLRAQLPRRLRQGPRRSCAPRAPRSRCTARDRTSRRTIDGHGRSTPPAPCASRIGSATGLTCSAQGVGRGPGEVEAAGVEAAGRACCQEPERGRCGCGRSRRGSRAASIAAHDLADAALVHHVAGPHAGDSPWWSRPGWP